MPREKYPEPGPPEDPKPQDHTPVVEPNPEPPPRPKVLPNYKPQQHELRAALETGMRNGDKFTTKILRKSLGLSEAKARVILWILEALGFLS